MQIDVWAAGVILYILLCGFPPFSSPDGDQDKLFDAILSARLEFPAPHFERVSAGAIDLVANMLRPQPELRFAAEDVLDHAWMAVSLFVIFIATLPPTGIEPVVTGETISLY